MFVTTPEATEINPPLKSARVIFELSGEAVELLAVRRAESQDGEVLAKVFVAMLERSVLPCR